MSQEFIVSILNDENDGDFSEGDLSLREAIALANDTESEDTITFDSSLNGGTITLIKDQSTGRPTLANAPLSITDSVTITGLGEDNITIDGDDGGNGVFIIDGAGEEIDVTVEDLTVANGAQIAFFFPGLSDPGGSFAVEENANLTLRNSLITGSSASIGGAIYNRGTVNIIDSTVENSYSGSSGPSSFGSGIDGVVFNTGEMYISDGSIINDNDGGAITNLGTLEVSDSQLTNNSSDYGGGAVDNRGDATIVGTQMIGNSGVDGGTAIENSEDGNLTIIESSIEDTGSGSSDNNVILSRGTTSIIGTTIRDNDGGGNVGVVVESGTTDIQNSTISDNRADNAQSGVIVGLEGTVNISNSTIANNQARSNAGIESSGTVNLTNSTVANNSGGLSSGGLRNFGTATVTSTILAGNTGGALVGDISGDGEFISGGNNLISNGDDGSGFVDGVNGDLVGTNGDDPENPNNDGLIDPQLGELQDNGGTTQTIALLDDSPAIDTGSNPNNLATDQRGEGFDRTVGEGTDIGAFEVQDLIDPPVTEELVVSTLDDENDGDFSEGDLSLREAIALAESGDTITFDSTLSGGTINLSLGELAIDNSLILQGLGAENIIIDGNGNSRVFNVDDGNEDTQIDVALNDLAITGGSGGEFDGTNMSLNNGAGIFNLENLEVNNANIYDNEAIFSGGGIFSSGTLTVNNSNIYSNSVGDGEDRTTTGGGIYSEGILTVNNSAIYNNSGFGGFGGAAGGGIYNLGSATIDQSTISDNAVGGRLNNAGGIFNSEGDLTITNSTISDNSSNLTGGIANSGGEVTVTSTIIANDGNQDISGDDFTSGGNNFISGEAEVSSRIGPLIISAEGFVDGENGDIVGTIDNPIDPLLGELQNNGGSTPTQALLEGSPAIDTGSNPNNLEFDQRGEGFDRTIGEGTDIGAFEVQDQIDPPVTEELVVSTLDDENDGDFSEGDLSLREAIALAESGDTITFDESLSGGTINLVIDELLIDKSLNIEGLGADRLTVAGGNNGTSDIRVFEVDDGNPDLLSDVTISGLTITGGTSSSFGSVGSNFLEAGGGIFNTENLTVDRSAITGNNSRTFGGGIYNRGALTVTNSSITDNTVLNGNPRSFDPSIAPDGGGIFNRGVTTIINSTVANNVGINGGGIISQRFNENLFFATPEIKSLFEPQLTITNSTIAGNSGAGINSRGVFFPSSGAGILNIDGETTISSTIVANNDRDLAIQGTESVIISNGNNLISNGDGFVGAVASDLVGTVDNPIDPQLGELQNNGGSTPTQALLSESPAIDAGSNPNNLEFDQRGEGFDRTVGEATDIGAFEVQDIIDPPVAEDLVVSTLDDENDGNFSEGDLSLREAIALASVSEGADTITFDSALSGGTITLNSALSNDLIIGDSVSIIGLGQDNLTIDGAFVFKLPVFDAELNIDGLNIVGGTVDSFGDLNITDTTISQSSSRGSSDNSSIISRGSLNLSDSNVIDSSGGGDLGILIESGTADIINSTIANHEGVLDGSGVLITTSETVNITNSTIANNSNRFAGGVANAGGGTVNITNSTIANNTGGLGNGGIQNSFGTVILESTIVAGNGGASAGDVAGDGEFISNGNNLIGNGDDAEAFVNGVNGDIVGTNGDNPENPDNSGLVDPQLGELQNNGGSTLTLALLDGSPAIDGGSNPNDLATDQRGEGFDRTIGNATDIGAFEVQDTDEPNPSEDDLFNGTDEADRFNGLGGNDLIFGNGGDDTLRGADGNDTIDGGEGNDSIAGGNLDDLLSGDGGDDTISGNRGNDTIFGNDGNDSLNGASGQDILFGNNGHDTLNGGGGQDIINGGSGNDNLLGGGGRDTLIGGAGEDTLAGNNGRDIFVLTSGNSLDNIVDFMDGRDLLELGEGLSFDHLSIVGNDSSSGVLILDTNNHDAVLASISNVSLADIDARDFVNV